MQGTVDNAIRKQPSARPRGAPTKQGVHDAIAPQLAPALRDTAAQLSVIAHIFTSRQDFYHKRQIALAGSAIIGRTWISEMPAMTMNTVKTMHPVGMVVDDDALVRETVAEVMEDMCDQVYQASNGEEGLELLRNHPDISVIVTDIAMPRLDGVTFASQARQMHPDLKVLFVSGLQRPPPSEEFLAKPFRARALVSALHQLLRAH